MRALCDRINIDKQKTISQTLRFPYNARVYIMRASYDSIDNKKKMCEKVNKDKAFIQFFYSTRFRSTELFKKFFSLLTLLLLFCKKLVGREKMELLANIPIHSQRIKTLCAKYTLATTQQRYKGRSPPIWDGLRCSSPFL